VAGARTRIEHFNPALFGLQAGRRGALREEVVPDDGLRRSTLVRNVLIQLWAGHIVRPRISKGESIMAEAGTLHDAFIDELRDVYDAEKQLIKALPKMAKAAHSGELRRLLEEHLEETRGQVARLEEVFASIEEKPRGKHCEGIAGIIEEGKSVMEEDLDESTLDACIVAAGQRAEHYEMAAYGTLVAWARAMGHEDAAELLEQTLEEEKTADEKLSAVAEGGINQEAAHLAHPELTAAAYERQPAGKAARGGARGNQGNQGRGGTRGTKTAGRAQGRRR
jgi:ferritin-like metal-binding protein YciE